MLTLDFGMNDWAIHLLWEFGCLWLSARARADVALEGIIPYLAMLAFVSMREITQ